MIFIKPKRKVSKVFVHCSASDNPAHDNVATITAWHIERGFNTIGYHTYINKAGILFTGRDLELVPAAQQGHNTGSIAICLGGLKDFTTNQLIAFKDYCRAINQAYAGRITFHGHSEVSAKSCPVFDYRTLLSLDDKGYMPLKKSTN